MKAQSLCCGASAISHRTKVGLRRSSRDAKVHTLTSRVLLVFPPLSSIPSTLAAHEARGLTMRWRAVPRVSCHMLAV
jgi:hypothetical protein